MWSVSSIKCNRGTQEWLRGPEGGCGAFFAPIVVPALLCRTVQESDPRDVPLGLFLERMAQTSPFCLQVKTEICVLLLGADVRTQILCRSLGCSLGSDYLSQFPFLCVSLWLMKAKREARDLSTSPEGSQRSYRISQNEGSGGPSF